MNRAAVPRTSPERGFTLLEILVVIVLIAILSAAAINTINFVAKDADAETEAKRFAALARLAAEEALLTGREYGLRIDDEQLRFFVFEDLAGQWQPLADVRVFEPRPIPGSIDMDLVLEGQEIMLGDADADSEDDGLLGLDDDEGTDDDAAIEQPQIMFLSSGQVTPFTLTVEERDSGQAWIVESDLLGRTDVREVGE